MIFLFILFLFVITLLYPPRYLWLWFPDADIRTNVVLRQENNLVIQLNNEIDTENAWVASRNRHLTNLYTAARNLQYDYNFIVEYEIVQ
jgi:hypothetical protein